MKKPLLSAIIICCLCLGCKSKASHHEAHNDAIDAASPAISANTLEMPYFFASGTEPFWSLEISDDLITFKTPTDSILMPYSNPAMAQDSNVKRYNIHTETDNMVIQISHIECTNAMSGKVSPYTVSIDKKNVIETEYQTLKGCGHYNLDYRLHDIWVLESLNGKTISKENFSKEVPSMEIKAAENSFSGYAGCNQMSGALFFENGFLRFTNLTTTEILCEPSNAEADFLKALQSTTNYSIENNRLTLSNPSGTMLIFKKID